MRFRGERGRAGDLGTQGTAYWPLEHVCPFSHPLDSDLHGLRMVGDENPRDGAAFPLLAPGG